MSESELDLSHGCGFVSLKTIAHSDIRPDTEFSLLVVGKKVWPNTQSINGLWWASQWYTSLQSMRNGVELHKV